MKKIMVLMMAGVMAASVPVAAFADGAHLSASRNVYVGHGNFHGNHGYNGFRGQRYAHYGRWHGNGCCYGGWDDGDSDFVGPLIAGGVIGAVLGSALNR